MKSLLFNRLNTKRGEDEKFECQICSDIIETKDFIPLFSCEHLFHKECLSKYIETQLEVKKFPIFCPNEECKKEIDERDLEDILSSALFSKYNKFRMESFIESKSDEFSCCPTADCKYIFFYDKADGTNFECPMCKKNYCLTCKCIYHKGQSCAEYRISNQHTVIESLG